ncbi:MAG: GHKL domain-containing protein [Eubacterium sp.]
MFNMIFYWGSTFLFILIIKEFMGIFFVKKNVSYLFSLFIWCAFYIFQAVGTSLITVPICTLFFELASSFLLVMILYEGGIRKKLIWIFIFNLIGMITETLVGYVFIFEDIRISNVEILGSFISKIVMLVIVMILQLFNQARLKRDIPVGYWIMLFLIPLGSIFVLNTLFSLCELSDKKEESLMALLSSIFILGINFMIFHIYDNLSYRLEIKKQQIIFDKQVELCRNQIHEREESNINIRNIKHDFENHLICIKEYVERKNWECANKYIDELLKGEKYLGNGMGIKTGNIVVDAIINYKKSIMQQLGIEMNTHIEIPYELKFNDADVSVIIGNCLDNAIEAVSKLKDINKKNVTVELIYRKNNLMFKIVNPYLGNIKQDKQGNFITTKKNAENHGIGLNSVKRAADKYNGLVTINTDNNKFVVQVLLYA